MRNRTGYWEDSGARTADRGESQRPSWRHRSTLPGRVCLVYAQGDGGELAVTNPVIMEVLAGAGANRQRQLGGVRG